MFCDVRPRMGDGSALMMLTTLIAQVLLLHPCAHSTGATFGHQKLWERKAEQVTGMKNPTNKPLNLTSPK